MTPSRRDFIKKAGASSAVLAVGGVLPGFSAVSYNRILGANERVLVAGIGVGVTNPDGNLRCNFNQLFSYTNEKSIIFNYDYFGRFK